jgi:hypothetical protein
MKDVTNESKKNTETAEKPKKAVTKVKRRESYRFLFDMMSVLFTRG